jgi:hypothetical protein
MSENYYFEGDPATDSARRHLERVLKNDRPRRRWPWVLTAIAGVGAWYFWPRGTRQPRNVQARTDPEKR